MESIFIEHPVLASTIALAIFVAVGAIDLVVLKNNTIAIIFWILGFFVVLAPLVSMQPLGIVELLLIAVFGISYVFAVYKTYLALRTHPEKEVPPPNKQEM